MPLVGGPSDKAGNSYERRWTVFALIDLLEGRAQTLRTEVPGDDGVGSEFRLIVDGVPEWHQAKRQRSGGPWTVSALANEGVVQPWKAHLVRGERCVFVSSTGADELRELTERAESSRSWDEFDAEFLAAETVRKDFERLGRAWNDPPEADVYAALRRVKVRTVGESELADWINDRVRACTTGAEPATVAAVLAQLADDSVHQELSADDVWTHLAQHGVTSRDLNRNAAVIHRVEDSAESFLARIRPLYIGGHELPRSEASTALDDLDDGRRTILAGAAGTGKSVVTAQVVTRARDRHWPVLVLSADRLPDAATTRQLGTELNLPDSPATVLAGVAAEGDALLVIDQLDAVSVASGRHPERFDLVTDLLREARSYPRMRVLLACRQFDLDNDRALRAVTHDDTTVVTVGDLDEEQIRRALADAGIPAETPAPLTKLLAVPLHLALYVELAQAGVGDLQSTRTPTELYHRYWTAKRTACRQARGGTDEWLAVVERLVERMSDRQELTVPEAVLDDLDQQAQVMASEGVLAVGQGRVAFFHETFFDYCFARQFLASGATIRDVLTGSDQDLFRRAQVRQILAYERSADVSRYVEDFAWLLTSPDVRLHIKALVVTLLDTLPNPTHEEWQVLRPHAEQPQSPLHFRLWQALRRNPAWFPVVDADGTWAALLRAGGDLANRAVWALSGSTSDHASRVCELLAEAPHSIWPARRREFLRITDVHRARELVDLLVTAINEGDFDAHENDLARILRQLAKTQPGWGAEVLATLVRRAAAAAETTNPFHPAARHRASSRDLASEFRTVATGAPRDFVDLLLPQLLDLMRANERPDWATTELVPDVLWSHHIYGSHVSLRDNLYDAMGLALAALAEADPAHASTVFGQLRAQPYEAAAFLLAQGYAGNPAAFADDATDWLAATPGARLLGYADATAWVSRQLVAAISPHCSPAHFDELIDALLYYAPPYERTYQGLRARGKTELCLLNGIDPGRRPSHVERRLAELRRKFGHDDVAPPRGATGGVVPPPIPEDRARRMTDRHWLNAMQQYGASDTMLRGGQLVGDAGTQAQVLETLTKEDPQRFARLLLAIPPGIAEAYVSAILRGLAGARLGCQLLVDVCRHARDLGGSDTNRWLVRLIQTHAAGTLDDEFIETVANVAVGDPDPAERPPGEPWNAGSIDSAALNSTRGAAALAIGQLVFEDPARLPLVEPALRQLVADPQPEVRAAAISVLTPLLYTNPDLALALFHDATNRAPKELLGSHYVENFLHHAVRQHRYPDIAAILQRMLTDADENARAIAARQLAVASYRGANIDSAIDAVLNSNDEIARAAAVSVFANNITYAPRRDRSIAIVSAALHDPSKAVRDAAARAFYHLDEEPLTDYAPLITAFADSPALAEGAGATLDTLESSRQPLPPAILDVCEAFVRANREAIGDIATAAAGDAMDIVQLTLRMHAQHTNPEVRRRCLDLVDQLIVLGAHNIERDLDTIER